MVAIISSYKANQEQIRFGIKKTLKLNKVKDEGHGYEFVGIAALCDPNPMTPPHQSVMLFVHMRVQCTFMYMRLQCSFIYCCFLEHSNFFQSTLITQCLPYKQASTPQQRDSCN